MVIKNIIFRDYKLPLKKEWRTSKGVLFYREGWVVCIQTIQHTEGYGDCFPMSDMGTESLPASRDYSEYLQIVLKGKTIAEGLTFLTQNAFNYPNTHFAFETALLMIQAEENESSIAHILNKNHKKTLLVNDNLGALNKIKKEDIKKSIDNSYKILKIKVGVLPLNEEIKKLKEISRLLTPSIQLRLDANQAWSKNDALTFLNKAKNLPIESIEEPLKTPNIESLLYLQNQTRLVIAIDESLKYMLKNDLIFQSNIRRFVIKPAVLGGLCASLKIAKKAQHNRIECIVTSMIESSIGLSSTIQLAAAIDNGNLSHGLATAKWIKKNIGIEPKIKKAMISINNYNGFLRN
jgi:o-succinylbenzoate synthase